MIHVIFSPFSDDVEPIQLPSSAGNVINLVAKMLYDEAVAKTLYDEATEESWKAFSYILLQTPFVHKLKLEYVSLSAVIEKGFSDVLVTKLLERGADPNGYISERNIKQPPLDVAIKNNRNHTAVLLIRDGAKVDKLVTIKANEPTLHTIMRITLRNGK